MTNIDYFYELYRISTIIFILENFYILSYTYLTDLKITNNQQVNFKKKCLVFFVLLLFSLLVPIIRYKIGSFFYYVYCISIITGLIYFTVRKSLYYSLLVGLLSISINYILFLISTTICFFPNIVLAIKSDFINLILIAAIHAILLFLLFKIKRFNKGISSVNNKNGSDYLDLFALNICSIIIFCYMIIFNYDILPAKNIIAVFIIFAFIMFINIKKSITLYYKDNLLAKELKDTKKDLDNKEKEIKNLEKENLDYGKSIHTIKHKQKVLEYKLNKLATNSEIASELDITKDLKSITQNLSEPSKPVTLSKTDIAEIDDILQYMQSECINNNIEFNLKLNGNINRMINNYIDKSDLQILLADHIKDAIIAVNSSENINRSIFVKLGLINKVYSLCIYDTGAEFDIDTLLSLGQKPITTHKESGSTGLGFMNTFDCLNKYKASIYINEIGSPAKDNYTKSITISFDELNKKIISSYRNDEIRKRINNIKSLFSIEDSKN